jgi:hypothetical protein
MYLRSVIEINAVSNIFNGSHPTVGQRLMALGQL